MSAQSDLKNYADAVIEVALERGKYVIEAAQAGLGKLQHDLASSSAADSIAPNVDAVRASLEPLVATALAYTAKLAGTAESTAADIRNDKRVAQVLLTGEALINAIVEAVQERVGKATAVAGTAAATAAAGAASASGFVRDHRPVKKAAPVVKPTAKTTTAPAKTTTAPAKTTTTPVKAVRATKAAAKAPAKSAAKSPAKTVTTKTTKAAPAKATTKPAQPAKATKSAPSD